MSNLGTLSANAIKALYDIESNDTLITLVTFKANAALGVTSDIRLTDTAVQRISEDATDVVYGAISNGNQFIYLPLGITLPNDDANTAPKCQLVLQDVTRYLIPTIRELNGPPEVSIQLALHSSPSIIEMEYTGFKLTNISYSANTITGDLTIPTLEVEPFPSHSFTPAYFPGLF